MQEKIEKATSYITKHIPRYPDIAVILGSGLGGLANVVTDKIEIDYKKIKVLTFLYVNTHRSHAL